MSRSRDIALFLGATEASNPGNVTLASTDTAGGVDSASTLTLVGYEKDIFRVNSQNLDSNHTIDSADNAMSAGPITVDSGVTVTINGNWTVV